MRYRGRLIHPLRVRVAPLDVRATAADPDGAGALVSGYDDVYREPVRLDDVSTTRKEGDVVELSAQVEEGAWEVMREVASGDSSHSALTLVFHYADLEAAGLVDARGEATVPRKGDRLVEVRDDAGNTLLAVRTPPGLYCTRAEPRGLGLGGGRNLWVCAFEERGNARGG